MQKKIANFAIIAVLYINIYSMELDRVEENLKSKELGLLNLPYEIIDHILYHLLKPHIDLLLEKIQDSQDIFCLHFQEFKKLKFEIKTKIKAELNLLSQASKQMQVYGLDFREKIDRLFEKLIEKRTKEFAQDIKEEYTNLFKDINLEFKKKLDALNNCSPRLINISQASRNNLKDNIRLLLQESAKLIIAGADSQAQDISGNTALIFASRFGDYQMVDFLLALEQLLNGQCNSDNLAKKALIIAANMGYDKTVEILLERGVNPNIQYEYDDTALMHAASLGHDQTVELLLSRGANPNIQNEDGDTALIMATSWGYEKTVKLLISGGADINFANRFSQTALSIAAEKNNDKIVQLLDKYNC